MLNILIFHVYWKRPGSLEIRAATPAWALDNGQTEEVMRLGFYRIRSGQDFRNYDELDYYCRSGFFHGTFPPFLTSFSCMLTLYSLSLSYLSHSCSTTINDPPPLKTRT
jgi:hypothetical protein